MDMIYKKIMPLLIVIIIIAMTSVAYAEDTGTDSSTISSDTPTAKTFMATGHSVGYTKDNGYSNIVLTKKAKKQFKKIKKYYKKHRTYKVTLTAEQFNSLVNAKKQGKIKEIQVKTNQYVKIYKPVLKRCKKKIFSKKYYKSTKFEKAAAKFDDKYGYDDDYKVTIDEKCKKSKDTGAYITVYKKITIIKKYYKVKRYKAIKDRITGSVVVNDRQSDYKNLVYFFAPKLGIDGEVATAKINI